MRKSAGEGRIVQAVVKAIGATFDRSSWMELGLITGKLDYITSHARLLRSLDWGDGDYLSHVIETVPVILGKTRTKQSQWPYGFVNLSLVEDYLHLEDFLQREEPVLYGELYAGEAHTIVDELQVTSQELELEYVEIHAGRIRRGLRDDPELAIGASKELLKTVLKAILGLHGNGAETKVDIPKLVEDVNARLGLDATGHRGAEHGAEQRRKLFGSLSSIVSSTAELRNAGFGTGNGGVQRPELDVATAHLVVSSAVALATFYLEAYSAEES
ncbi:abortive infection Abi-like protein [Rhodoglobus vestalii]|uniref:Abortive infection Abi-like protein n=1 Tax=Rhodoglobus vestalii TaxID=193384 RepID=A0A8H2K2I7_9MICO|nr:abortive infection family protein [Rhodoglobus vestalii]TQO18523.1 abortive infection Abi-like protein [Rhodoglobus vestalii]